VRITIKKDSEMKTNLDPSAWREARKSYSEASVEAKQRSSWFGLLEFLFFASLVGGVISLVLAPFTGVTVITAAAFFICAWFLHKCLGGE
jgi:hypothetical protein